MVDALYSENTDGQANLMPRLGLISHFDDTSFDPLSDIPSAFFGATLNVTSSKRPNSPTGSYKLGLKSGNKFVETALVRQGSTVSQITLVGYPTYWTPNHGPPGPLL